jgi:hypothetical protein
VYLIAAAGPQAYQLVPVASQLPQFPHPGRGDPRLRQAAHPQQVSKISRIPLIV